MTNLFSFSSFEHLSWLFVEYNNSRLVINWIWAILSQVCYVTAFKLTVNKRYYWPNYNISWNIDLNTNDVGL